MGWLKQPNQRQTTAKPKETGTNTTKQKYSKHGLIHKHSGRAPIEGIRQSPHSEALPSLGQSGGVEEINISGEPPLARAGSGHENRAEKCKASAPTHQGAISCTPPLRLQPPKAAEQDSRAMPRPLSTAPPTRRNEINGLFTHHRTRQIWGNPDREQIRTGEPRWRKIELAGKQKTKKHAPQPLQTHLFSP